MVTALACTASGFGCRTQVNYRIQGSGFEVLVLGFGVYG